MSPPASYPSARELAEGAVRFLFFTGKGGVGKTSLACAISLRLADEGKRVLLVSTDPASNLDEVLGLTLGRTASAVPGAPGLSALNINPEEAAKGLSGESARSCSWTATRGCFTQHGRATLWCLHHGNCRF